MSRAVRAGGPGASRAAGALALMALATGTPSRGGAPDPCAAPRALRDGSPLPAVRCSGGSDGTDPIVGAARLLFGRGLDPNRAAPADLEALPGIGPARAAAIAREARLRPFCADVDLERVDGIGPATRRALAGWLEMPARPGCGLP